MADNRHGSMDITEHRRTFGKFLGWMMWGSVVVALILVFLAIVGT